MTEPRIALIAAVANNGVIGSGGKLPWRLATDLQRFRRLTMGKPVIMGRKTFQGLGRPLAGRTNIVVSRQPNPFGQDGFPGESVVLCRDLDQALATATALCHATGAEEVMVAGGGEIYAAAIGRADRLYITHVDAAPAGDTLFPTIEQDLWTPVSRQAIAAGPKDSAASEFVVYERARR